MVMEEDLLPVIAELKETSEKLSFLAELLQKHSKTDAAQVEPEAPKAAEEKPVTLEEVRGVLAAKASQGFTSEVKNLLQKFGASKLSEVAPENFKALREEAEAIVHAG